MNVRALSSRRLVVASPYAQSTPGDGGTITGQLPSSFASAFACSGPAPPNATSAKSRESKPCCTDTSRSAPNMFSLTMSTMPAAAVSASGRPIASATFWTAARAAATSSVISPPRRRGGRYPSTTFASVTVGSSPPRP